MQKIISLDIAGFVLLVVILFSTISRRMTRGASNKVFMMMLVSTIAADVFDIMAIALDNALSQNAVLLYLSHSLYLLFHNFISPAYLLYAISLSDIWHTFRGKKAYVALLNVPFLAVFVMLAINPFTGWIFNLGAGEVMTYTRGPLFVLLYISTLWYVAISAFYIFKYSAVLGKSRVMALVAIFPLMTIAMVAQFFFPAYALEMFANAIGLLLITMTIQRPEEIIDPTTGLRKLSCYADNIKTAFSNDNHITVILINISNFANVSAMLGYEAAKDLLYEVGERITHANRQLKAHSDNYHRGRGQFSVVINSFNQDKIEPFAQELSRELARSFSINGQNVELVTHICVVKCPEEIGDFRSLLAFSEEFHRTSPVGEVSYAKDILNKKNFSLVTDIDEIIEAALTNHNFQVYYQPIYSVEKKRFVTAEALLRLIDPVHGFISPDVFIPAAEKSGAIHRIGEFVLEEVCSFIDSSEYKALKLDYIEINLSVAQCMQNDLADKVLDVLQRHNVSTDRINLEITETAASYSQNAMTVNLNRLSAAGVSFSLDDYGTGYSNMKRVISLPVKIVKLDKSFVDEQNNPKMWIVLQNTVRMLKDMNMEIVVEGVETSEMLKQFSDLKCDFIQGYYFSKPIPKEAFVQFITNSLSMA